MGWPHSHVRQIKIGGISWLEFPLVEQVLPAPHQASHLRILVPGREVPIPSGCKNQQGLWLGEMEDLWSSRQFLLKGPCTDLLGVTHFELQHWSSSLKNTRDIQGRNEVSDISTRARGAAFSRIEVLEEAIVPFLSPSPTDLAGGCYIRVSFNLATTVRPALVIS